MTNQLQITDLFGKNIQNFTEPFILLHLATPIDYLIRVDNMKDNINTFPTYNSLSPSEREYYHHSVRNYKMHSILKNRIYYDNDSIWDLNRRKLHNDLKQMYSSSIKHYAMTGHLWFPTSIIIDPITILLVNTTSEYVQKINNFEFIAKYKNGSVYCPNVEIDGHTPFGLYFFKVEPQQKYTSYCIKESILVPYLGETFTVDNITNLNEFNTLSIKTISARTIDRTHFIKKEENILPKLSLNNNEKNISPESSLNNNEKIFFYNTSGQLIQNGKCVQSPSVVNPQYNGIYYEKCSPITEQKWYKYDDVLKSQYNGTCLEYDNKNNHLLIKKCIPNTTQQKWESIESIPNNKLTVKQNKQQNLEYDNQIHDQWNIQGNHVILTEADNPWYLRKDNQLAITKKVDNVIKTDYIYDINRNQVEVPADFDTSQRNDPLKKYTDQGFGHSYSDRYVKTLKNSNNLENKKNRIEQFDFNYQNLIITHPLFYIILVLTISLCVYTIFYVITSN